MLYNAVVHTAPPFDQIWIWPKGQIPLGIPIETKREKKVRSQRAVWSHRNEENFPAQHCKGIRQNGNRCSISVQYSQITPRSYARVEPVSPTARVVLGWKVLKTRFSVLGNFFKKGFFLLFSTGRGTANPGHIVAAPSSVYISYTKPHLRIMGHGWVP